MGEWDVTEAMIVYGGNFVRQLGMLIRAADDDNKRRLVEAFPEYLAEYREIARLDTVLARLQSKGDDECRSRNAVDAGACAGTESRDAQSAASAEATARAWLGRQIVKDGREPMLDEGDCRLCGCAAGERHEPTDPCGIVAAVLARLQQVEEEKNDRDYWHSQAHLLASELEAERDKRWCRCGDEASICAICHTLPDAAAESPLQPLKGEQKTDQGAARQT